MRALVALLALTGCATSVTASGPAPSPTPLSTVAHDRATFGLWITNQSFNDPQARLMVTIDDRQVVDEPFEVGGQHNFFDYPLRLGPGEHVLVATGPNGARLEKRFELPEEGDRFGVLSYWNYEDEGPRFTWDLSKDPPAFG